MKGKTIAQLAHIKNSSVVLSPEILVQKSKSFSVLVKKLYSEGYILSFKTLQKSQNFETFSKQFTLVPTNSMSFLRYKTLSSPSKKVYLKSSDLSMLGVQKDNYFVSTAMGIKTVLECKKKRLGGVLLFTC